MDEFHDNRAVTASVIAEADALILVDEADRRVGHLSKVLCHQGRGILHRAFSLLIFNGAATGNGGRFGELYPVVYARMEPDLAGSPRPNARFAVSIGLLALLAVR